MNLLKLMGVSSLLAPTFISSVFAAELGGNLQASASNIINQPSIDGYRLDGCKVFGGECNGQAAESYCLTQGFTGVAAYSISEDFGFDTKTIGSEQICDGSLYMCGAYEQISCASTWNYQYITSVNPDTGANITRIEPRYVYEGEHTALLTMAEHDAATMSKVSQGFDDIYEFYQTNAGYTPWTHINYFDKLSIAEVESRWTMCGEGGYGCGFIGATGIEIISDGLTGNGNGLISLVKDKNQWSMTLAYELGRNFMPPTIANKLKYNGQDIGNITTGFAIYMGHTSVEKTGKTIAPAQVAVRNDIEEILNVIEQDVNLTFENTFLGSQSITVNGRNLGGADMMASVLWHFENKYGAVVYQNFWKEMTALNAPINSINDAANGFVVAMSLAVGEDVSAEFSSKWGWPELSADYRALLPATGCNTPSWNAQKAYNGGDIVVDNNNFWRAKWWSQNEKPGSVTWGAWESISGC